MQYNQQFILVLFLSDQLSITLVRTSKHNKAKEKNNRPLSFLDTVTANQTSRSDRCTGDINHPKIYTAELQIRRENKMTVR